MKALLHSVILLLAMSALALWLANSDTDAVLSNAWMDQHVSGHGLAGRALFVVLTGALIAVGVPRQIPCFLAGHAFGFAEGSLWALFASLVGGVTTFGAARTLTPRSWRTRFAGLARKFDALLRAQPLRSSMVLRFLPLGHNMATNAAAGLSGVPALRFLLGSLIGWVPQTLIFALLGSGTEVDSGWRIALGIALFALSAWLGLRMLRQNRATEKALAA